MLGAQLLAQGAPAAGTTGQSRGASACGIGDRSAGWSIRRPCEERGERSNPAAPRLDCFARGSAMTGLPSAAPLRHRASARTGRTAATAGRRRWSRPLSPGSMQEFGLFDASPIMLNAAHGGAGRDFANAVALVESDLDPPEMLTRLKAIEREFGRRRGRRWGAARARPRHRPVERRQVPFARADHPAPASLRSRSFVLQPLAAIAPGWRVRPAHRPPSRRAPCPQRRREANRAPAVGP